jgi:hypothetical protein
MFPPDFIRSRSRATVAISFNSETLRSCPDNRHT